LRNYAQEIFLEYGRGLWFMQGSESYKILKTKHLAMLGVFVYIYTEK
jgi:hypothetical protein